MKKNQQGLQMGWMWDVTERTELMNDSEDSGRSHQNRVAINGWRGDCGMTSQPLGTRGQESSQGMLNLIPLLCIKGETLQKYLDKSKVRVEVKAEDTDLGVAKFR